MPGQRCPVTVLCPPGDSLPEPHDLEGGPVPDDATPAEPEEFTPTGTIAIVGLFVATLILLWLAIYAILIARGVTV